MYIISDLNGNLVQASNREIDNLQDLVSDFEIAMDRPLIFTDNEGLYKKTLVTGYFDIVVENNKIIDIVPIEKPTKEEHIKEPAVEDYLIDLDFRVSKIELGLEV